MSESPSLASTGPQRRVVGQELGIALDRRVFTPARAVGKDLSVLAVTKPMPPVQYQRSPSGAWWVANDLDHDLVRASRGGQMTAPPEVVATLRGLHEAGVQFDHVWVLHELPGDWEPGTPAPNMELAPTEPSPSTRAVATQDATIGLFKKLFSAAATARAGVGRAIAYDPVVLGGIKDPERNLIAWVALAYWDEVAR